jgi:SAM-dependent methyltransferase
MPTGSDHKAALDELYSSSQDPWQYATNPDEVSKYQALINALPAARYKYGLEIGCSVGVFTEMLASRVDRLLAVDISEVALNQARDRLSGTANIEFGQFDLIGDDFDERFDLIICSEVLYYIPPFKRFSTMRKLATWIEPDGVIALVHSTRDYTREWTDIYGEGGGERLHDYFVRVLGHRALVRVQQDGYELVIVEGKSGLGSALSRRASRLHLGALNIYPGTCRIMFRFVRRHPLLHSSAMRIYETRCRLLRRKRVMSPDYEESESARDR